jgi:hypothetical protein
VQRLACHEIETSSVARTAHHQTFEMPMLQKRYLMRAHTPDGTQLPADPCDENPLIAHIDPPHGSLAEGTVTANILPIAGGPGRCMVLVLRRDGATPLAEAFAPRHVMNVMNAMIAVRFLLG